MQRSKLEHDMIRQSYNTMQFYDRSTIFDHLSVINIIGIAFNVSYWNDDEDFWFGRGSADN